MVPLQLAALTRLVVGWLLAFRRQRSLVTENLGSMTHSIKSQTDAANKRFVRIAFRLKLTCVTHCKRDLEA